MKPTQVIDRVVAAYNGAAGLAYSVKSFPDRSNRTTKEIDAIAEAEGHPPLAIEHTKLQTIENQTQDSRWFQDAFGAVAEDFRHSFPFLLHLVFPYEAVQKGQDWPSMRSILAIWLQSRADGLPMGRSYHNIAGLPFVLTVWKSTKRRSRSVFLSRAVPQDQSTALERQMDRQLDHKYERLGEYQRAGSITLLVLESEDIALVNWGILYQAFLAVRSVSPRPYLDQIWVACTFDDDCEVCCFSGPSNVMRANPENYLIDDRYDHHWREHPKNVDVSSRSD